MDNLVYLRDLVVILVFGVIIVTVFHRLRLPAIAGFILAGVVVGPKGLGLINDIHNVEVLAEIGVALLLFGIGLELSLEKLKRLWKITLAGGFFQVGLTTLTVYVIAGLFGLPPRAALFAGFLVALSSTAIVLRGLQMRGEVASPHGRLTLAILVFQDFSVVPMMLIIPLLAGSEVLTGKILIKLGQSVAIIIGVLLAAHLLIPRLLNLIARTRQRQLFILSIFVICIGTAWLITSSGASLAIGAFLAGLVVAGSEYRHQALADLIAFREVFASLFFVSVGMLLVPSIIVDNIITIFLLLAAIMLGKALIVFLTALLLRMPPRVALLSAVSLAQVGEFSLVLLFAAQGADLLDQSLESSLVSAAILSMFLTPFALSFGPRLAAEAGRFRHLSRLMRLTEVPDAVERGPEMSDHVIVGGYGFAGRELTRALQQCRIPYAIADINVDNIKAADDEAGHAYYGDITSHEVLLGLGIGSARELVLLINEPAAMEQAIRSARSLSPDLPITVRTNYLLDIEPLLAAGATEVVAAEREAAVEVTLRLLKRCRVDEAEICRHCSRIRSRLEEESG